MKVPKLVQIALAVMLYVALFLFIITQLADVLDFSTLFESRSRLLKGALLTLGLSLASLVSSMILGFLIFLMTESVNVFLKTTAGIYKEIIMGTPLLVLVFVVVYIIGVALGIHNKMMLGFLALTLYMSPYMTNIFDGAYKSISRNQFMVMDFYGFNLYQKYRYIILPQMIRPLIPGLINNLSAIIKGTSILSTIAIADIFYTTQVLSNNSYRYIEGYFVLWMVYLLITIPLSMLAKYLSRQEIY
ncbi:MULTISPECIES: amino acid ABC transporter permease [unclassified Oceanispirochaeta]|uniref:amino acid ABC transporter permease n=1 Tax=unclassified Oceanispirochaeta TaxID=2635722 RepID=UPI000E09BE74|nr:MULTISPECIES: ABC transporter permease subunit [unclassified Oceanispirochaeta]MBF9016954.1 ABC transporter permease subunit [Oceanispirochaeta sp. M2]NPD73317.1 ABC transporter permease subunit [Oceanispirochaeta sp. M1]RDG30979.1 ABC transporter permease subunit [Oceanispirochaeta sp. M1]